MFPLKIGRSIKPFKGIYSKMKKIKIKKPFYKKVWIWIIGVIVLSIGITALTMPFSYGVQKAMIRVVCKPGNMSTPNNYDEVLAATEMLKDVSYNSKYANGDMDIFSPKASTSKLPLLVYIHGGYYVGGDKKGGEPYCRVIAKEGYIVANINYVLAPDEFYPAQVIQCNEAIKFLLENHEKYNIDINNIFIGGDSAGSHLSGVMGAFYTNEKLREKIDIEPSIEANQLKGVVLLCGFYDMLTVRQIRFPLLNDAMWMLTGVKKYEKYERVSELNTIQNITENYPATYLLCGDNDPLYKQNLQMKEKLAEYNISTTAYLPKSTKDKLKHEFQREFELQEAQTAMTLLINFLEENTN